MKDIGGNTFKKGKLKNVDDNDEDDELFSWYGCPAKGV